MKILLFIILILMGSSYLFSQSNDQQEFNYHPNAKLDSSKKSLNAAAIAKIGEANILIQYHSPGVRNRLIWGGLVPYDEVWVTGAHNATSIEIDKDFSIDNKLFSKGKYALFTIPGKEKWVIIINKNFEQHLADDYDIRDDLMRLEVQPEYLSSKLERLEYNVQNLEANQAHISMSWDRLKVSFDVRIIN